MDSTVMVPLVVVAVATLSAAVSDLRRFKVPNVLTFPLIVSGVAYNGITGGGAGLQGSLGGTFFGFAVVFLFYAMGAMGAGDVKLMAGVGAWLGMPATAYVFGFAGLATGLYSLVLLVRHGRVGQVAAQLRVGLLRLRAVGRHLGAEQRVESVVKRSDRRQRLVPFAAMIALAVVLLLVWACKS
jgi:prepilin peptidase CpaA